jgi:hypothetical protein
MVVLCYADTRVTGRTDDLVEVLIGDSTAAMPEIKKKKLRLLVFIK